LDLDKLTVTHINPQGTAERNRQTAFLHNNHINRRIQIKATIHMDTDVAAGAGKLSNSFFI
jgi:hypothetical protein